VPLKVFQFIKSVFLGKELNNRRNKTEEITQEESKDRIPLEKGTYLKVARFCLGNDPRTTCFCEDWPQVGEHFLYEGIYTAREIKGMGRLIPVIERIDKYGRLNEEFILLGSLIKEEKYKVISLKEADILDSTTESEALNWAKYCESLKREKQGHIKKAKAFKQGDYVTCIKENTKIDYFYKGNRVKSYISCKK